MERIEVYRASFARRRKIANENKTQTAVGQSREIKNELQDSNGLNKGISQHEKNSQEQERAEVQKVPRREPGVNRIEPVKMADLTNRLFKILIRDINENTNCNRD